MTLLTHSFIHSFVRLFVHLFTRSLTNSLIHADTHSFIHSLLSYIYSSVTPSLAQEFTNDQLQHSENYIPPTHLCSQTCKTSCARAYTPPLAAAPHPFPYKALSHIERDRTLVKQCVREFRVSEVSAHRAPVTRLVEGVTVFRIYVT